MITLSLQQDSVSIFYFPVAMGQVLKKDCGFRGRTLLAPQGGIYVWAQWPALPRGMQHMASTPQRQVLSFPHPSPRRITNRDPALSFFL